MQATLPEGVVARPDTVDGLRELRAMAMLTLPVPPLPIMVHKELIDERNAVDGTYHTSSSHDLVAHLLNVHAACNVTNINKRRKLLQIAAHRKLLKRFDDFAQQQCRDSGENRSPAVPPVGTCYEFFCDFTREYVHALTTSDLEHDSPANKYPPDLRMIPVHDVDTKHPIYMQTLDFVKAQDVVFGRCTLLPENSVPYDQMSYAELLHISGKRIVEGGGTGLPSTT